VPTAARYHAIRDRVVAAVDRSHAERVTVVPQGEGTQYRRGGMDPEREAITIEGVLRIGSSDNDLGGEGQNTWSSRLPAGKAMLAVDVKAWPAELGIRAGDIVRALTRLGEPEFTVEGADTKAINRVKFLLSAK